MSKSIHITKNNFKGLSKVELNEQAQDPRSQLNEWAKKRSIKKDVIKNRNQNGTKLNH